MEFTITRDDENQFFVNIFNSYGILMTRIPVDEKFVKLSEAKQYKWLQDNYSNVLNRIR